jgi:hypothetical protein
MSLAVSDTSIRISPFIWSSMRLLADFTRIHSRNLPSFLTPYRSSGYRRSAGTLSCGLQRPTWLVWRGEQSVQVSASSGAHRDVLLPSGGLGHGGSSAGAFSALPSLLSWETNFLLVSGAEKSSPAVAPLTGRPAARGGLFVRGGGGFNHRALGGASLCLCRQRHGPVSGQWPGRRASSF